ncbi:hypothetical protein OOZ51_01575 [Arthrobacter sp. MI7-26]|uniref:hypothetical protein n=1 Tax=Arthrobacter sp. MI7-26 TaxID=2993653 RepID=UPI0022490BC4|nr:hypothetical protein [Arthrobacter sp. MI7-26]MCX2746503.1 hypothetical protein [Arthrobacter sp. MI7-26]
MSRPPLNPAQDPNVPGDDGQGTSHNNSAVASGGGRRPKGIVVISIVVVLEALALLAAAALYIYQLAIGAPVSSFWGAVFTLALLLAFSAWLFAVGHFLFRGYRWTRAAALVAQLFVMTIGFPTITGGLLLAGLAMVVPALVVIVLLFDKRVIAFASRTGGSRAAL